MPRTRLVRSLGAALLMGCTASPAATSTPTLSPVADLSPVPAALGIEAPVSAPVEALPVVLLKNARLIDGTGAAVQDRVDILVEHGKIAEVARGLVPTAKSRVIDLAGRTLLPGFIDTHVHLSISPADSYPQTVVNSVTHSEADRALFGARNAKKTLAAGFTTVRNVGGSLVDRALRDAIANGLVPGPRMLVANYAIGITGGHCDGTNHFHPQVFPTAQDYRHGVADGPDEVRKAVRYQVKHGADVIKVCATGGVLSQGDAVGAPQLTLDELTAAVQEANRADRRVAAHAHGNQGIRDAVMAGVHSIEHGSILDPPTVELMLARGTVLVPTLYVAQAVLEQADAGMLSPDSAAKARQIAPKMRRSFKLAYQAGVKIALGSDAGVFEHGLNGKEFAVMVEQGMTPMDAIVAGTSRAAELLGLDHVGTVSPGRLADLVVVDGDPLADISVLQSPVMVMKGGALHVPPQWK